MPIFQDLGLHHCWFKVEMNVCLKTSLRSELGKLYLHVHVDVVGGS